jgi:hypothetical protein
VTGWEFRVDSCNDTSVCWDESSTAIIDLGSDDFLLVAVGFAAGFRSSPTKLVDESSSLGKSDDDDISESRDGFGSLATLDVDVPAWAAASADACLAKIMSRSLSKYCSYALPPISFMISLSS